VFKVIESLCSSSYFRIFLSPYSELLALLTLRIRDCSFTWESDSVDEVGDYFNTETKALNLRLSAGYFTMEGL
jgi:hypothetical protein